MGTRLASAWRSAHPLRVQRVLQRLALLVRQRLLGHAQLAALAAQLLAQRGQRGAGTFASSSSSLCLPCPDHTDLGQCIKTRLTRMRGTPALPALSPPRPAWLPPRQAGPTPRPARTPQAPWTPRGGFISIDLRGISTVAACFGCTTFLVPQTSTTWSHPLSMSGRPCWHRWGRAGRA